MPPAKEKAKKEAAPKKKVEKEAKPKLVQPDKAKYNKEIADKNAEIEHLQRDMQTVQKKLQEKNQDKDDFMKKKKLLANKMQVFGEEIKRLNDERKELKTQVIGKVNNSKMLNKSLKNAQQSITFKSEEALDARIKEIEFEMFTGTLTLQEEKRKVQEIQQLKKQKPKINATREKVEALESKQEELKADKGIEELEEQIKTVDLKVADVWKAKEAIKKEYLMLVDNNKKQNETSELYEEKTNLKNQISALIQSRNELRKQLQEEEVAYRKAKQEEVRLAQERRHQANQERKEADEKEKMEEDLMIQPHLAEVALLEQTITFCKSLLPKEKNDEELKKETAFNNPEGYAVLKNKNDREEEFYMVSSKKKGLTKKNKAAPSQTIKHDAWTFQQFDALEIKAPNTTKEIPDTLVQLQEKLDEYKEKITEWECKKADGTLREEWLAKNNARKEAEEAAAAEAEARNKAKNEETAAEAEA